MVQDRTWTTVWDRTNHRVLLFAGRGRDDIHWSFVEHDQANSVEDAYDIWRISDSAGAERTSGTLGDVVFVEVRLDDNDNPIGFPDHLLDVHLLGSRTIWPFPDMASFIWWFDQHG